MSGVNVGYIRVSTVEQNEARQVEKLKSLGIDFEKIYMDKVSGKDTNRPELQKMLNYIRKDDTVYISEFSRLARSTIDLLRLVEDFKEKGIKLVSIKENLNTDTPEGKLMLTMLAGIAEFERTLIRQRQAEGIEAAKKRGVYKGRKAVELPDNADEIFERYKMRELKSYEAYEMLGIGKSSFFKYYKKYVENN